MAIKLSTTSLARKMAIKTKLAVYLERALDKGDFEWEFKYETKKSDDAWHPSGDCTPTLNELYLKAIGEAEQRPISVGLRKTFMIGHFWHQYLQELTKKMGFADEWSIERVGTRMWGELLNENKYLEAIPKPYHWVRGAADIAPCELPGHGPYVVDFKTMGSHDFKQTSLPAWAAAKYEAQINIYMDFFDIEKGLILAINKDSPHDFKEFEFYRNQDLIDTIYKKWHIVSECLNEGIEPPEDEVIELPTKGTV